MSVAVGCAIVRGRGGDASVALSAKMVSINRGPKGGNCHTGLTTI